MSETPTVIRNPMRTELELDDPPRAPRDFHQRLPDYSPTPLRSPADLAADLGVAELLVKDEASRLGLPAFKMLGASWASYRALVDRLGYDIEPWTDVDELRVRLAPLQPLTLATATDGNHGRAVARFARLCGFSARIWMPEHTVRPRIEAIESEGASVTIARGGYDDAVREAAAAADDTTLVVSDTSWDGYVTVPAWVIDGYSTIFWEIEEQLDACGSRPPDVVAVPIGVGALAAAVVSHYRRPTAPRTTIVGVEPVSAACILESARSGHLVTLPGEQTSIMAGLNCGTGSPVAWPRVARGIDWFVTVSDDQASQAMRDLATGGIVSGESGAAALAGFRHAGAELRRSGVVDESSTVLVLSTEGATDPAAYERIVGHSAAEVHEP